MRTTKKERMLVALLAAHTAAVFAQATSNETTVNSAAAAPTAGTHALPEVTITGTREKELLSESPASIGIINKESIGQIGPSHPQQILSQVPGVAVAVTNGEGHTTAIRQPFTTAPLYLFLEDGLPIRATGFFNHNALYEINIPMAGGIEVIRGPGTALYGSDAIGGIVNVFTRAPASEPGLRLSGEAGSFGWLRAMVEGDLGDGRFGALSGGLNVTHTDGWRDRTAYDRQSGNLRWDTELGAASLETVFSASRIDQETGANSPLIEADYRNDPKKNNFPIAFRKVGAVRLSTAYERASGESLLSVTPYLRDNRMDLLASFMLSSDPTVSYSKNQSYGALAKWRQNFPQWRARLIAGFDVETSPGSREEDRLNVTVSGTGASRVFSAYTVANRVYDYDVTFNALSPYLHGEISPTEALRVTAGLRYDALSYRLQNHLAGAAVQGGTGAAFYGQAPNTKVSFEHLSPKLGATYALTHRLSVYSSYNTGFRAPSEGQLFRTSVSTTAAEAANKAALALRLKPIEARQFELGLRGEYTGFNFSVVAFELVKRDDLVSQRDLATNVSTGVNAGKTSHRGVEAGFGARLSTQWRVDSAFSYTRHKYVDWVTATADFSGKEIEAAPRVLANTRLTWSPLEAVFAQLEWVRIGSYWLEASNSSAFPKYSGHDLLNLRSRWAITKHVALFGRVLNLADKRYADSAQVSSNTPVYSPGLPRAYYAGVEAKW